MCRAVCDSRQLLRMPHYPELARCQRDETTDRKFVKNVCRCTKNVISLF